MALQHEDSQAWAEAETGVTAPASPAWQAEGAACDSTQSNLDESDGATDVVDMEMARANIQDCSVIVGIHPDQE